MCLYQASYKSELIKCLYQAPYKSLVGTSPTSSIKQGLNRAYLCTLSPKEALFPVCLGQTRAIHLSSTQPNLARIEVKNLQIKAQVINSTSDQT